MEFKPLVGLTPELFIVLANTLILFLVLKKLLFEKVMHVMDEREAGIKSDMEIGERAKEEGLRLKSEYEEKIDLAKNESQEIFDKARKRAEEKSSEIIAQAKVEATNIKEKASEDIARERQTVFNNIKSEISDMALLAASKVIEKDIDKEKHEDLIDDFIKDVGDAR
ncbi:F0F1 ATP synthase subunit B [Peptostreptococcus canis]|uniref:ATP synthase subunit b n=1 Tax=Peptostreptococcus canis TaxID=1159213 RepID=A0ABR6TLN0_9FIRM|nr:F0F1 ATP synthase subunit B [Peptostreptococcus canis]MBC2576312.1 F0F1 ATP synthase subunit B [Peptostreptococcus canis]MBP1998510.1 F-type H+-transporting ATPase subunit b [Peptostreptococcus canis]